jgi:hypothetical protein
VRDKNKVRLQWLCGQSRLKAVWVGRNKHSSVQCSAVGEGKDEHKEKVQQQQQHS